MLLEGFKEPMDLPLDERRRGSISASRTVAPDGASGPRVPALKPGARALPGAIGPERRRG